MFDIDIIGLAQSGKTTIFNVLTNVKIGIDGPDSHIGVAKVPEPRLEMLADMLHPKKVVPTEIRYHDIATTTHDSLKKEVISNQSLAQLGNPDALISVVRAFTDESIPHIEGSLNVERDIDTINLELIFSDLAIIEHRLQRIETSLKGAKQAERQSLLLEQEKLMKLKDSLEKDVPIWKLPLTPSEAKALASYQFLSAKPLLIVANIGEDHLPEAASLEAKLRSHYSDSKYHIIALCGKLEMELAQLDNNSAEDFRTEFGLVQSGRKRVIKLSYELLGLISFFTIASGEVKAWPVQNGTTALKAAGKIHSDMERGFIRAEVVGCDDLVNCGSMAEVRKKGLLRLEGKNYIVQDGDVITFLFNL